MSANFRKMIFLAIACFLFNAFVPVTAHASGMLPETSVVIINEADGEASMNVKNTDANATLLYTSIQNLPEDKENLLVVTPPVARVEPDETQLFCKARSRSRRNASSALFSKASRSSQKMVASR